MLNPSRVISVGLLALCAVFVSIPGVLALWHFFVPPAPITVQAEAGVAVFDYPPEVVVPGGSTGVVAGQDHLDLLRLIVEDRTYGLNATKKTIIHDYLEDVGDVFYCGQHTSGGNMKEFFVDTNDESKLLYFVITKKSDTEYHTFTFRYVDITDNPVGTEIEVYKTIMTKENGVWGYTYSYRGWAKVNAPGVKWAPRGIDVKTYRDA